MSFKTDVVVFIHAPTRKLALELVDRFSSVVVDDGLSYRIVSSSDDAPDNIADDRRVGGRATSEDKIISR